MRPLAPFALPLILISLGMAACGGGTSASLAPASEPRPNAAAPIVVPPGKALVIGASMVLTGPNAAAGNEDSHAIVAEVNRWKAANGGRIKGHDIAVDIEDDGCTEADITAVAAQRLLKQEGLVGVIGPSCSAGAERVIDDYNRAGVVLISGAATATGLTRGRSTGSFFFRTIYRNDLQGQLVGIFARNSLHATSAFLVDDAEAYGQDLAGAGQQALEANGVSVTRASVRRGTVDFADLAKRITGADPDFVGFGGFNPEAALFYRQLRDAGYKGPFGAGDAVASLANFVNPVGSEQAEGVYFAGCALPLPTDFAAEYKTANGGEPRASAFVAHTADATRVLLDAVNKVAQAQPDGSLTVDPLALRDAVATTNITDGVSGHVRFDDRGDRTSDSQDLSQQAIDLGWTACQVKSGQLVHIFP